jgi:hypothetical protein
MMFEYKSLLNVSKILVHKFFSKRVPKEKRTHSAVCKLDSDEEMTSTI